jgi:CO/xanthine dehydrogenase FAD-binding subunit
VPPLLTLETEVELASNDGTRRIPLEDFLQGPRQTALQDGELLVALHIPRPLAHTTSAFEKLGARTYLVISIAMTAVVIGLDESGLINHARIAVGSCAPVAKRLYALEADLIGTAPGALAITQTHLADLSPISDVRADDAYRREAVPHQITRAIKAATLG